MNFISSAFGIPLGYVMWAITKITSNYGLALLIFTFLTRIIMFPLAINQQKSSAKMAMIQPQLKVLQDKYKNDQNRLQQEMSKLYQEAGYNPSSGCLPLLIQFPILFGLVDVIYKPLTHIIRMPADALAMAKGLFEKLGLPAATANVLELEMIKAIKGNNQYFVGIGATYIAAINELKYNFLGMNLMTRPELSMITGMFSGKFDPVVFIPILSGVTSFLMSWLSMRNSPTAGNDATAGTMKGMMYTMPLMSVFIAFSVPAGIGLYWTYSNIFGIFQSLIVNKFYNQKEMIEGLEGLQADKKLARKEEEKEARKIIQQELLGDADTDQNLTQKEIDSLRLAAGRKRTEEKYKFVSDNDVEEDYQDLKDKKS